MLRPLICVGLALCALLPAASAPRWEARGAEYVLRIGSEEVRYRPPGTLAVGSPGGPTVNLALFLWHGNWVYERLEAGRVTEGPQLDARGWIRQAGTWVTREGAPPMRYSLALEPTASGALLHFETEKTGPLTLTAGIWLVAHLDRAAFGGGQRVWARLAAHGKVGRAVGGDCEALLVELRPGRAVSVAPEGFASVRSRISAESHSLEMCLRPGDFAVGEKVRLRLKVGVDSMPTQLPGEIRPSRSPLAIGRVWPARGHVPRFGRLELDVDLRATWDNPFDPDDVRLDAEVTTASGRRFVQPGFFMVEHRREVRGGVEAMVPTGRSGWRVRVAAVEPGPLRCRLIACDRTGSTTKAVGPFTVARAGGKGFLRRSGLDPHYLRYDSGDPFFPIGHNVPIYHTSGQLGVDAIRKMAAHGENYNRWWMSNHGLGIEWEDRLGWYRQATAARLDYLLDVAEELGFTYMLCMDTHQDFREDGWNANPYNKANGGPCATVRDWFTDPQARALYRKRLRYTVARWAYSPQILCWEFGNEFEGWADTPEDVKIAWHREMARYLASLDPYRHLISTSWWSSTGPAACWQIPEMDIVQTHCYTNNDANVAEQVREYCLHQWRRFQKPHIFGEFGIRSHTTTADKDPRGWALHNAAWAAVCSGCVGIPAPWWHENYIEPLDLYFHFTAIARFVKGLPFGTARWEQIGVQPPEYAAPPTETIARDLVLTPVGTWGRAEVSEFVVQPDGTVNDPRSLHELLHGMGHQDLRNPPTFIVEYPRPGRFLLTVGRVSNSGLLRIWVDDTLVLEREFPCGQGIGKESVYRPEWRLWESVYDEDVSVEVPAGKHRIRVDNLGRDWMRVTRYLFSGCRLVDRPDLLVAALRANDPHGRPQVAIVWIQNRQSDWCNHGRGLVPPVPPSRITLEGLPDGAYEVEWWETWLGKPGHTDRVRASGGKLVLLTGEVATDVAVRIRPGK